MDVRNSFFIFVCSLQLYSNHYQITYYTIIILFFIGIVQFVKEFKDKNLIVFFKNLFLLILAGTLGGLQIIQDLSTTLEYGPETQRGKSELVNEEGIETQDGLGLEYFLLDGVMENRNYDFFDSKLYGRFYQQVVVF